EPGTRFVYSDVGFIVAAEIIHRVSGKRLDGFARENIYAPLLMKDTLFNDTELVKALPILLGRTQTPGLDFNEQFVAWRGQIERTAPTENREGRWMRGEVHDPRSYEMGGVAGHAGLFSTADDLAIFCQMILNGGEYGGTRVLAPYTVARMLSAHSLPTAQMRGIGWDVNTSYSSNRGDLFPVGTF